jgi:hypothetical protein
MSTENYVLMGRIFEALIGIGLGMMFGTLLFKTVRRIIGYLVDNKKSIRRFFGRLLGYEQQLLEIWIEFDKHSSFVWNNVKFTDAKGICDPNNDYDSEEVAYKWEQFNDDVRKIKRLINGG